ncbi:beta-ketoacyl [acyl carrier protein] synthase domain-containing protein, partial [Priestia megaterium]|uniref:beta-ketoacyl [acyl carrier protein] synthase domain-containing protein n=1 Tax=Priestia megaterium TaxID=1404 RepID=UPI0036DB8A6A
GLRKEPIAIVGMSGRFGGSADVEQLWRHLAQGDDLIEPVTRWDMSLYHPTGAQGRDHGSFIDDMDRFDPTFFNISGIEATYMDPQQRVFLEEAWKALEDAGYAGAGTQGRQVGVYVGCQESGYAQLFAGEAPPQSMWGNALSAMPARISYYLDLQGPAISVDTACSSSLVAMHLACQGLWAQETEMALAGGVALQCTPQFYLIAGQAGMLSASGRCHTFDDRADGFVPGEGAGVVVLKRLSDALADGDHIHGVISGSGINQDGASNGITAPSARSQERLETSVYEGFGIHPEHIQMMEAHG